MYKITLTKEQAEVVAKALDLFARIGCGEFREVLRHPTIMKKLISRHEFDISSAMQYLDYAKVEVTHTPLHQFDGIPTADEPNRIAYDIFQVIRNRIAWDENPAGGYEVDFHEPMQWSTQPLPKIEQE